MTSSTTHETAGTTSELKHTKLHIQHSVHQLVRQAVFARALEPSESLIPGTVMGFHGLFTRSHTPGQEPELWTTVSMASLLAFLQHKAGGQQANGDLQKTIVPLSGFSVSSAPEFFSTDEAGVLTLAAGFDMSRPIAGPALPESIEPLAALVDDIMARADKVGALRIGWSLLLRVPKPESPPEETERADRLVTREVCRFADWLESLADEQTRMEAEASMFEDFSSALISGRERKIMRAESRLRPILSDRATNALLAGFSVCRGLLTREEKAGLQTALVAVRTFVEPEHV